MSYFNATLRALFDALLYPFRGLPPLVGLAVLSLPVSILVLIAFKGSTDQARLAAVKRRIHAGLFEIRLFSDDFRAIFRAQLEVLRHNLSYLRISLWGMRWLIVPVVLLMIQLHFHYGYRGLAPGESALVEVELGELEGAPSDKPDMSLEVPDGLRLETPAVWIPSLRRMAWRIGAERPGDYELGVSWRGSTYSKTVRVSEKVVRRSPLRVGSGFFDQLLYPAEPPLPAGSPLGSISVAYPEDPQILGMPRWMWIFFLLLVVFALLLRNRLGVTI